MENIFIMEGKKNDGFTITVFYFITKTNSCLFDIQFHRLPRRTCKVHCQDQNVITFDFIKDMSFS